LNLTTVFPNGGRFKCKLTHNNGVDGTYTFNTSSFIYDNDGSTTSATFSTIEFDEKVATIRQFSGVAYYGLNSTFALTASNINLLNEITFPTTKQIDFVCNNLAISNSGVNFLNGHADGTKSGVGATITGWSIDWNKSGLTFSRDAAINIPENYVPGFTSISSNALNSANVSSVTGRLFDYSSPDVSKTSNTKMTLIDTDTPGVVTSLSNPVDSESGRISFNGVFTNGSSTFNSTIALGTNPNQSELQYIFGRIIYPQHNFKTYMPKINATLDVDYSSLSGVTQNFDAVTAVGVNGTGATTTLSLSGYRWFVTSYSKTDNSSFNNGTFTFDCNFNENDLHCKNGVSSTLGTEDLVIIVGVDSTGTNTTPNKFFFISGDSSVYGGRDQGVVNYLSGSGQTNKITFSKGTISWSTKKCWLFIGFKNTTRGKSLILNDILFSA
jgi:hypothetical protein